LGAKVGEKTDKMKVLVFTSLFPNNIWPNHGVFIKNRMKNVSLQEEVTVKVVAPVPYFPPIKGASRWLYSQVLRKENIEGLEIYHPRYLMIPKVAMFLHGLMMALGAILGVRKIRKNFDFDIIDAHYVYPDGFAAVLLGLYFGCPVIVSARGSDINQFSTFPFIRRFLCFTLNRATHVISVCKALKETMVSLGIRPEKISVIPNGVDWQNFSPLPQNEARKVLSLPNKRIILSIGALIPRKGFDLLINSFKRVVDTTKKDDLYLVIVGEGREREPLIKLVDRLGLTDRVLLVGAISHGELNKWYGLMWF
jgi:glycosyltransferase involved in cell wall biosynthesis